MSASNSQRDDLIKRLREFDCWGEMDRRERGDLSYLLGDAAEALERQSGPSEREPKGLNGWIMPSITPDTDREVLLLMKKRHNYECIVIGRYEGWRGWWRPRGSNGNFAEDVEGWRELPATPSATSDDGK